MLFPLPSPQSGPEYPTLQHKTVRPPSHLKDEGLCIPIQFVDYDEVVENIPVFRLDTRGQLHSTHILPLSRPDDRKSLLGISFEGLASGKAQFTRSSQHIRLQLWQRNVTFPLSYLLADSLCGSAEQDVGTQQSPVELTSGGTNP